MIQAIRRSNQPDLDNGTVEAIFEGNNIGFGITCFSQLSEDQIQAVEAVAMDMTADYVKATKAMTPLPEEKIVYDIFHVMKLANETVEKVRRSEHLARSKVGDNRLPKTQYIWLTGQENLSEKQVGSSITSLRFRSKVLGDHLVKHFHRLAEFYQRFDQGIGSVATFFSSTSCPSCCSEDEHGWDNRATLENR